MSCDKNRLSPSMNIDKGIHNCRVFLENGLWFMQFFVRSIGVLLWVGEKGLGCCGDALFMRPFGFAQGDRWGDSIEFFITTTPVEGSEDAGGDFTATASAMAVLGEADFFVGYGALL